MEAVASQGKGKGKDLGQSKWASVDGWAGECLHRGEWVSGWLGGRAAGAVGW